MFKTTAKCNVAIAAATLIVLTGCSGPGGSGGGSGENITLGALLPQTGDLAALGKNTAAGVKLAVKQANGNNDNFKVSLELQDSGTQESIAQSAMQQLLAKNVSAIVGAVSSAVCLSVVDTTVQARIPMISPACTTPQLTHYKDDGYFYRTAAPSEAQGTLLAQLAYKDGKRNVAVMAVNNSYGQSIADNFVKEFTSLGGTIAVNVKYDAASKSFTAETQQVAGAKPDAIVLVGYVDTAAAIVHDAAQRGLLDLQWYTGDGIRDNTFPKQALPSEPQKIYTWKGIGVGTVDSDAAHRYEDAYQKEYSGKAPSFSAQAYDATWVSILAAILAHQNGDTVKDEIANVTDASGTKCVAEDCIPLVAKGTKGTKVAYQGATGAVEFDQNGDPAKAVFGVWQFSDGGIKNIQNIAVGK